MKGWDKLCTCRHNSCSFQWDLNSRVFWWTEPRASMWSITVGMWFPLLYLGYVMSITMIEGQTCAREFYLSTVLARAPLFMENSTFMISDNIKQIPLGIAKPAVFSWNSWYFSPCCFIIIIIIAPLAGHSEKPIFQIPFCIMELRIVLIKAIYLLWPSSYV